LSLRHNVREAIFAKATLSIQKTFYKEDIFIAYIHLDCKSFIFITFQRMSKIDKEKLNTWVKLTDDFYLDPDGILGKGCFGEVFRGYSTKR